MGLYCFTPQIKTGISVINLKFVELLYVPIDVTFMKNYPSLLLLNFKGKVFWKWTFWCNIRIKISSISPK